MHDSIRLENRSIPTVAIATHEFRAAAGAQAAQLGRPDFEPVFVPHPIQDQTVEEIRARADAVIEEIMRRLVTP